MLRICALAIIGCSFAALSHGQPILTMSSSLIPPPAIYKRDASPSNPVQKQNQKPLFRLVEDGDEEARKAYFLRREKALHDDYNGANSGPQHPPEHLPVVGVVAPSVTDEAVRSKRHAPARFQVGVVYATQPPSRAAPTASAAGSGVGGTVQSARDEYRKNRFAGSSILKALALANAKPQAIIEGGGYGK